MKIPEKTTEPMDKPLAFLVFQPRESEYDYLVFVDENRAGDNVDELQQAGHDAEIVPLYAK